MHSTDLQELPVWIIRRSLGISLVLFFFYLLAPSLWAIPPLSTADVLAILTVVFLGVLLGVGFSYVYPIPPETGLPRVFRTIVLTVPALGIGLAIYITIEGAEGDRAYWIMFALAAWLGSLWQPAEYRVEADDDSTDEETAAGS